ncbi:MAG: radical SAM protein [Candidatus Anammoximicrobium sp.]|nr:radical SAM protein [Candidatus Anammoximicrobium sp.]
MSINPFHLQHERRFAGNRFVYPVISRRSRGVSIGVNLNPDKACNFHCVYCQVDRTVAGDTQFVDVERLLAELDQTLTLAVSGRLFETDKFRNLPSTLRRLNDIAFSGDGEPTTHRNFDEILAACAEVKRRHGLDDVKMVLITNASRFHRPHVQRGLEILDRNQGEIWAKLDAGTEDYFRAIDRSPIPLARVLENIAQAARLRPLVIQSLWMRIRGKPPPDEELQAFCQRLREITAGGGRLSLIQVYTVARRPAESYVTPLSDDEVDWIAAVVGRETGLPAAAFYGAGT